MAAKILTQNKKPKPEKFFFNRHCFDEEAEPEEDVVEEDLPPPPPTYSEEELEQARQKSFAEGKAEGQKEVRDSIEKATQDTLAEIERSLTQFGEAESGREKVYEREAVELALALFQKLYPAYEQSGGFEDLSANIQMILQDQHGHAKIEIAVAPDMAEPVQTRLNETGSVQNITVTSDPSLNPGACLLRWQDGGAIRNTAELADKISDKVTQVLAGTAPDGHDKIKDETEHSPDSEPENSGKNTTGSDNI